MKLFSNREKKVISQCPDTKLVLLFCSFSDYLSIDFCTKFKAIISDHIYVLYLYSILSVLLNLNLNFVYFLLHLCDSVILQESNVTAAMSLVCVFC